MSIFKFVLAGCLLWSLSSWAASPVKKGPTKAKAASKKVLKKKSSAQVQALPKKVKRSSKIVSQTGSKGEKEISSSAVDSMSISLRSRKTPARRTPRRIPTSTGPVAPRAKVNLSRDIAESDANLRQDRNRMRPEEVAKMRAPKKNSKVYLTEPKETVQVPDNVEWDHNRRSLENQVEQMERAAPAVTPVKPD